ncbi:MAG: ThuA domain-containing protein [Verrucomicrobiota bacterium]
MSRDCITKKLALLISVAAMLLSSAVSGNDARVLIVVGPTDHPPGVHECAADGRLLAHCLENMENLPGIEADVVEEWPGKELQDAASTVVFLGDGFPPNRFPNADQNLADLEGMMARGCGIVCIHYATGLFGEDVSPKGEHPLLRWMGGYFAHKSCPHHQSVAKVFHDATITPAAPEHPVSRGWNEFVFTDEPYIQNYFGEHGGELGPNVTAFATSMLPPEDPKKEVVAWGIDREDGGRGFGIVMLHFYKNWLLEDLRRFILNGIVWSAGLEVPEDGVKTAKPDLDSFGASSLEFIPRKKQPPKAPKGTP